VTRPKDQGTAWETELVNRAQTAGLLADRLPEGGPNDRGDVWINHNTVTSSQMAVVAWKRLTGTGQRRTPDGARDVVVMTTDDFLALAANNLDVGFVVEAKARQTLNVTRELEKARRKAIG